MELRRQIVVLEEEALAYDKRRIRPFVAISENLGQARAKLRQTIHRIQSYCKEFRIVRYQFFGD